MARGRREIPPSSKTYGLPLYCAAWVPLDRIPAPADEENDDKDATTDDSDKKKEGGSGKEEPSPSPDPPPPPRGDDLVVALGGGGGEGRSGVPNALLLSRFDLPSRSLADHPECRLGTDADVPYRMAMHPGGDGVLCSFPKGCRLFEWEFPEGREANRLALVPSERILTQLEDAGMQLGLAFNAEGSMLGAGGEDGHLRVFKWPSMEIILDQADAHKSVKDLDFSIGSKFLVSSGDSGPCRIWDLESSTVVVSLPREDGEVFGFSRFSQSFDNSQIVYVAANHGGHGKIISWDTDSKNRVGSKKIVSDPISAFNVSADGKLLGIGTIEGSIVVVNSDMRVVTTVEKAHLGLVTALVFSQDSRALLSTSFDSTVKVTLIEENRKKGVNIWLILLILLISFLLFFTNIKGVVSNV